MFRYVYDEAGERLLKTDDMGRPLAAYVAGGYLTDTSLVLPLRLNGRLVGVLENGIFRSVLADARGTLVGEGGAANVPTPYGLRATRPRLGAALDYVEKGYDDDLGAVRMGVRDYDPYLGQFLTPDPLYASSLTACSGSPTECTLYGYAANDPLRVIDRDGRAGQLALAAGAAAGGALVGGSLELGRQLVSNGWSFSKVSWGRVGAAAAGGAVTSGLAVATLGGSLAAGGATAAAAVTAESAATSVALRGAATAAIGMYSRGAANAVGGTVERTLNGEPTTGEQVAQEVAMGVVGGVKNVAGTPAAARATATASGAGRATAASVQWKGFSKGKLTEHFEKHGREFGKVSQPEYLQKAKDFATEAGATLRERKVGNFIVKHDPATGRVMIGHAGRREIRTFYMDDGRSADPLEKAADYARKLVEGQQK